MTSVLLHTHPNPPNKTQTGEMFQQYIQWHKLIQLDLNSVYVLIYYLYVQNKQLAPRPALKIPVRPAKRHSSNALQTFVQLFVPKW